MYRVSHVVDKIHSLTGVKCQCNHIDGKCVTRVFISYLQTVCLRTPPVVHGGTTVGKASPRFPAGTLLVGQNRVAVLTDDDMHGVKLTCGQPNFIQITKIDLKLFTTAYFPENWLYHPCD